MYSKYNKIKKKLNRLETRQKKLIKLLFIKNSMTRDQLRSKMNELM